MIEHAHEVRKLDCIRAAMLQELDIPEAISEPEDWAMECSRCCQ